MADMTPSKGPAEPPRRKPHSIPPVPSKRDWREEFVALKDVPEALAMSLWRTLRNVWTWTEAASERRKGLFCPPVLDRLEAVAYGCLHAPHLLEPFGTFLFMLRAPAEVQAAQVAGACRQVYEWAEPRSLLLTAVHFAEAAGTVAPEDPIYANDAGWMCFRAGLYERAEEWYSRGYGLAVRMRHTNLTVSRDQSIRALLRTGILLQTLGRHEEAKRYFDLAAGRAARTGRAPLAAKANHDLMLYMAEVGSYAEAEGYASTALDLYARNAPQLPALAHDYGLLLVQSRRCLHAVPLLQLAVPRILVPEHQALAWSTLARAAAGAGRRELYEDARDHALARVALHPEHAPGVFIHLGEGARTLREWDRAESYAASALETSRLRQRAYGERLALTLLDQIATRMAGDPEEPVPDLDEVRRLARRFVTRLQCWKAPGSDEPGGCREGELMPET